MRTRALALLLPLTAGDYLLWNWSVAGSHDVLALAAGMTLLPLAAVSLGFLGAALLRLLAHALRRSSRMSPRMSARGSKPSRSAPGAAARGAAAPGAAAPGAAAVGAAAPERAGASAASERQPSSSKLAA